MFRMLTNYLYKSPVVCLHTYDSPLIVIIIVVYFDFNMINLEQYVNAVNVKYNCYFNLKTEQRTLIEATIFLFAHLIRFSEELAN